MTGQQAQNVLSKPARRTFGISSLMLLIALAAVCLAVIRVVPGQGVALLLVVAPAWVRTNQLANLRGEQGRPLSILLAIRAFLDSLAIVLAISTVTFLAALAGFVPVIAVGNILFDGLMMIPVTILAVVYGVFTARNIALRMTRDLWHWRNFPR